MARITVGTLWAVPLLSLALVAGCASPPPFEEQVSDPFAAPLPASEAIQTAPLDAGTEDASDTVLADGPGTLVERLPNTCKLENYQIHQGQDGAIAASQVTERPTRVVGPTDIVTQEYNPQRVNFYTDAGGQVRRISCG